MKLNTKQLDLLRLLCRQREPSPVDHLDGRVVRALESRGLVETHRGWTSATEDGHAELRRQQAPPAARRRGRKRKEPPGRAQIILRAVDELERALPAGVEINLGRFPAYAEDVLESLRQFARKMGQSSGGAPSARPSLEVSGKKRVMS